MQLCKALRDMNILLKKKDGEMFRLTPNEIQCGCFIKDGKQFHVMYNKLFNSPVILDDEGYEFISEHQSVSIMDEYQADVAKFLANCICNHLYEPIGIDYKRIISNAESCHLKKIENCSYTTMLDLRVSTACNFGCKHCIAATAKTNQVMTLSQAKKIVDAYVGFISNNSISNPIDVHFGIAEPLLVSDIVKETIEYINSKYSERQHMYSINTNLSLLDLDTAIFFRDNDVQIHASIDGLKECNDSIRFYADGSGTFDDIERKMSLLKDIGYPLHDIGVTLTEKNYPLFKDEVNAFINWCQKWDIKEVACEFDLINSMQIDSDEKVSFLMELMEKMAKVHIDFDGTWSIPHRNLVNATYADSAFAFCRGGSGINLSVNPNGDVYICSCSSKKVCSIFNIEQESKKNGAFYDMVLKNLLLEKKNCFDCEIAGCCVGQCAVTREYHPQEDGKISEQCEFYKKITRALLMRDAIYEKI